MDDTEKTNIYQQTSSPQGTIIPEEVSAEIERPEEISGSIPPDFPTDVPVYQESNNKWMFVIGAILFFLIVFGLIYWFFLRDLIQPLKPPSSSTEDITLTYWGLWDEKDVFQPVIDDYQKKNQHITIAYEKMSSEQYRVRLLARSQTGNGPDIFRFHNTWLPEIQEVITAIPADIMTVEEFNAIFYPIHQKDLKINDQYYGIPLMVDGTVLIYNEDIIKQAGLLNPPTTWVGEGNDVLSAIKQLTVKDTSGNIITAGMAIGTATNIEHFGEIFGVLLLLNGGDFKDLSTQEAAEALELYRKFAEDGYWNEAMPVSTTAFIQGKVAMIFGPSWQILNIKSQNPDLNIKVAPVPQGLDGSAISIANYWAEGVNKFSQHQAEAWKFLKFLSEKEQLLKIHETQSKTRLFGTAYPRRDMGELLHDHPYLSAVIQQAEDDAYTSLPLVDRTFDAGLNDEILKYLEDAISSTANGTEYSAALGTAGQGIKTVLERYKIE
ncbi:MAG: Extracellular solute-binding protein, family 1 [Candidatus Roizmanbacteria bacterium GW2011_GWA2_37_7]|uniref:Extracellular solute-binding protein, family 1 n=1 Tax=Candidatus Roizmanbacteria bacterium GW2011_GWA2_37_7 TaxID=1618481 RepID=A0A0G0H7X4_9BACT|nr:MAG: Extracellular solute-binding protein, family 1 [Candidatus Roizmanbacteria bacterium GW2011_GWA2_37_7]